MKNNLRMSDPRAWRVTVRGADLEVKYQPLSQPTVLFKYKTF